MEERERNREATREEARRRRAERGAGCEKRGARDEQRWRSGETSKGDKRRRRAERGARWRNRSKDLKLQICRVEEGDIKT